MAPANDEVNSEGDPKKHFSVSGLLDFPDKGGRSFIQKVKMANFMV